MTGFLTLGSRPKKRVRASDQLPPGKGGVASGVQELVDAIHNLHGSNRPATKRLIRQRLGTHVSDADVTPLITAAISAGYIQASGSGWVLTDAGLRYARSHPSSRFTQV